MRAVKKKSKGKKVKRDSPLLSDLRSGVFSEIRVSRVRIERDLCLESFEDFARSHWSSVVPEKLHWAPHMTEVCTALQNVAERVFAGKKKEEDLLINIPPGTSKSTLVSILFPPWTWARMPTSRTIAGSYDYDLSIDLGDRSRRVVKSDKYQQLFPEIELRDDTKSYISNTRGGERRCTSTGANITGKHGHFIIVDDPLNPLGARSEAESQTSNYWMSETLPSRCIDLTITPMILVMQRLSENDPSGVWLKRTVGVPVRWICLPAEQSSNVHPPELSRIYQDGLLDPIRLPQYILDEKRAVLGNFGYSGQYDQRPTPLTGGMFNTANLVISPAPPLTAFEQVVRFWDKAGTKDGPGARTAGIKMGRLRDQKAVPKFWVLDVLAGRWNSAEREKIIRQTAVLDTRSVEVWVEQEPGSGGKESAENTIRNLAGFRVFAERPTGDKFARADPFSVQVNSGNVGINTASWNTDYVDEMRSFGPGCTSLKDQIDGSSGAFNRIARRKGKAGAAGF